VLRRDAAQAALGSRGIFPNPFFIQLRKELPVSGVPFNFGSIFPSFAGFSVFNPKFPENFGSRATSNS
jgi:hypothetical protein